MDPVSNSLRIWVRILPHIYKAIIARYERKAANTKRNIIYNLNNTISDLQSLMGLHLDDSLFENIKSALNETINLKRNVDKQNNIVSELDKSYHLHDVLSAKKTGKFIYFFDSTLSKLCSGCSEDIKNKNDNLESELDSLGNYVNIINKHWNSRYNENSKGDILYHLETSNGIKPNTAIYNEISNLCSSELESFVKFHDFSAYKTKIREMES